MMDLDTAQSIEVITVSTSSNPGMSGKRVVPLQIDLEKFPSLDRDESNKLRRPVRPIDRQRMRPWLMELLDLGNVFGLRWTNRHQGIFQISWRHASRLGWNLETDGDVFERWARHTGIYKEGDPPEPKRWKANFRCALHSLHDVVELTNAVERRGRNACRTYRFLQSNDEQSISRKRAKARRAKDLQERPYEKQKKEPPETVELESASSEEPLSDSESECSQQDKVIVQKLDLKADIPEEEYFLHHDHDYSAGPDKTQKTIVLRQGVGSIVLHKEVFSAPDEGDEVQNLLISNLDQLASAAMSSALLEPTHQTMEHGKDLSERKLGRKSKERIKKSMDSKDEKILDNKRADFSLKNLLTGSKIKDRNNFESVGRLERNRRSSIDNGESVDAKNIEIESATDISKKGGKRKSSEHHSTTVKERRTDSSKMPVASSSSTRHRSGSPKILCRRSKRQKIKGEKDSSESTEPLMSSCLLLLEAATRLDNAEKNGQSSVQSALKGSKNKPGSKAAPKKVKQEDSDIKDSKSVETPNVTSGMLDESEWSVSDSQLLEQSSQGILRSTLESAGNEIDSGTSRSRPRTIRNLLKESDKSSISGVEKNNSVAETPCAQGLFSGSKIQTGTQTSVSSQKKGKGGLGKSLQTKNNYFVDIRINNGSDTNIANEKNHEKGTAVSVEEPLATAVGTSIVKSNSGVKQTVIQRSLPVLSSPIQKNTVSVSDSGTSVVIAHKVSGSGGSPQIFMSSGNSLLQSIVIPVESNTAGGTRVAMEKSSNPQDAGTAVEFLPLSSALLNLEKKTFVKSKRTGETPLLQADLLEKVNNRETFITIDNQKRLVRQDYLDMSTESSKKATVPKVSSLASQIGVTFTATSGMPAFSTALLSSSSSLSKPVSVSSRIIESVTSSEQSALETKSGTNNLISLKTGGKNSHTLILRNSQKRFLQTPVTSGQKRDVLVFDHGKESLDEIKLHVVPLESTGETKTNVQTIINRPVTTVSGFESAVPSQRSAVAQVVFDPSKGTLFKVSRTQPVPLTSVLQSQASGSKTPITLSVQPPHLSVSSPAASAMEKKQLPVVIGGRSFTVNNISTLRSNMDELTGTEGLIVSHPRETSQCEESMKPLETSMLPTNYSKESRGHLGSTVNSFEGCHDTEVNKNCPETVSPLQNQLNMTVEESSPQVLNIQEELKVKSISIEVEAARSSLHDGSTSVKSLAELCKSHLAHLFSSLDNQTSESEENDSVEAEEEFSSTLCSNQGEDFHQDEKPITAGHTHVLQAQLESQSAVSDGKDLVIHHNVYESRTTTNPIASKAKSESDGFGQLVENNSLLPQNSQSSSASEATKSNSDEECTFQLSKSGSIQESQGNFRDKLVMDPTAPLSIGEIPLFANSKGDSDSLSPASD